MKTTKLSDDGGDNIVNEFTAMLAAAISGANAQATFELTDGQGESTIILVTVGRVDRHLEEFDSAEEFF